MNLIPQPMDREQLAAIIEDIAARVRAGDSYEGNLVYTIPDADGEPPPNWGSWPDADADFWVHGVYRIGNLQGQGGVRMIGTVPAAPTARQP